MQATSEEIEVLYELQQADLDVKRMSKELDELPQRATILALRKKRAAIEAKREQVSKLAKEASKKLSRINDEDASLEKKENGIQAAIEAAGDDYRNVEARTKELNGIFKRRGDLVESRTEAEGELSKIKALEEQIATALAEVNAAESAATESFKAEGTALMQSISQTSAARQALMARLSPEVGAFFTKTSKLFETVSMATLTGGSCSVCRTKIEPGRLIDLRQEAPLAICPNCKRMLVITQD